MLSSKASTAVCGKDRAFTMCAFTDWLNEWMGGWMNEWPMTSKGPPPLSRDALGLMRFSAAFLRWRASRFLLFWTKAGSPGCPPPLMRGHSPRGLRLRANYFWPQDSNYAGYCWCLTFLPCCPRRLPRAQSRGPTGSPFQGQPDSKHKLNWAGIIYFFPCLMCRWQYLR